MDFLWNLLFKQHMGTKLIELVITTAWSVWFNRNKTQLGEAHQSMHEILMRARSLLAHLVQGSHEWSLGPTYVPLVQGQCGCCSLLPP